jgi:ribosomal protein S18 acetylase RimI-like enzyme
MIVTLQPAKEIYLAAIIALMNAAYRGVESERSWCTEAAYITGKRMDESLLSEEIAKGARYLVVKDLDTSVLQGCVSLRAVSPETWYLGSLTVDPALQNAGFGRRLLSAAEEHAAIRGARVIEMTVLNVRDALISWYERRGYRRTGETRPFPHEERRLGTPTRSDLEFVVLTKRLSGEGMKGGTESTSD